MLNGSMSKNDVVQSKNHDNSIHYHSLDKNNEFSERQVIFQTLNFIF